MPRFNQLKLARFSLNNWRIQVKINVLMVTAVTTVALVLTGASYVLMRQNSRTLTGEQLQNLSTQAMVTASESVTGSVKSLEALALSTDVILAVESANRAYDSRTQEQIDYQIKTLDEAWKAGDSMIDPILAKVGDNGLSAHLKLFQKQFPEQAEIFITDNHGLNIAMTDKTSDYWQADEGWWQAAFNNGQGSVFVSEVEYDESTQAWAIDIGIPVRSSTDQRVIGVLRGTADISPIVDGLANLHFGQTGRATLLDRNGHYLYVNDPAYLQQEAPPSIMGLMETGINTWQADVQDINGQPTLTAIHFMPGQLGEMLGWVVLVQEDASEVDGAIASSLQVSILIAFVVSLLLSVLGIVAAHSIAKPLGLMARALNDFSKGEQNSMTSQTIRERYAQRQDEIGILGRALGQSEAYLQDMAEVAQRVSGGDLTVSVTPRSNNDKLGNTFVTMIHGLQEMVGQVNFHAQNVSEAAGQLSAAADQSGRATSQIAATMQHVASGNQQQVMKVTQTAKSADQMKRATQGVAQGAQEQATAVTQAATLTSQITSAIGSVASSAEHGLEGSRQAAQVAKAGARTVQAAIDGMGRIQTKVGHSAERVKEMGRRSDQIGAIVETIDDIASQTNLLALNAAIEAARAGQHGKGFAVVADEVRKLAERASAATKEIGALIKDIQKTVNEAVTSMEDGAQEVNAGNARAAEAGAALAEITAVIGAVQDQVGEIATAAERMTQGSNELVNAMDTVSAVVEENTAAADEMAAGASEITGAVDEIASVSRENGVAIEEISASTEEMSAQVEEVTAAAQSLTEMAAALQQVVAQFKLNETGSPEPETLKPTPIDLPALKARLNGNGNGHRKEAVPPLRP